MKEPIKKVSRERQYQEVWYLRTGNIETTSKISPEVCLRIHEKKVRKVYGYKGGIDNGNSLYI